MKTLVLLGSGNVATHLFRAFRASQVVQVKQVYNHSPNTLGYFNSEVPVTTSFEELQDADLYVLALKDDVIAEVAQKLEKRRALVVHTSGAVDLAALPTRRKGVFYPLQTFSKQKEVDYTQIPFCLEANSRDDLIFLEQLAQDISGKSFRIDSFQRKKLHLSAVFVCNFVNYLYTVGERICRDSDIPFEILKPLITETANKVMRSSPKDVQTGPATRNDQTTIKAHLELLESYSDKQLYQLLTQAIQDFHGKKL